MSYTVIRDVTSALKALLKGGLVEEIKKIEVTSLSPGDKFEHESGLNVFLYRVEENAYLKNMNWIESKSSPAAPYSPLTLSLFYLLTPYAKKANAPDQEEDMAHKIMGRAMQIFHENPVLDDIHTPFFDADEELSGALKNSFDKIKISHRPISMDDLSKIWINTNQPYQLSAAYEVSLVQITPSMPAGVVAAPVQRTVVDVTTFGPPVISELQPSIAPVGSDIHIKGYRLSSLGYKTIVRIGDTAITDFEARSEKEIILKVPNQLTAGPDQLIKVCVGGCESNAMVYTVSPWIRALTPLRGPVDTADAKAVSLVITGQDFKRSIKINIGGIKIKNADINVIDDSRIETFVPKDLPNGNHDIELTAKGEPANVRVFEVIPLIIKTRPKKQKIGGTVSVEGQRLNGNTVIVDISGITINLGKNEDTDKVKFKVPEGLSVGMCELRVIVDGHESNILEFKVKE
jgi:hypothetical protein